MILSEFINVLPKEQHKNVVIVDKTLFGNTINYKLSDGGWNGSKKIKNVWVRPFMSTSSEDAPHNVQKLNVSVDFRIYIDVSGE